MSWYVYSLIALVTSAAYSLFQKWSLNLGIRRERFLLIIFSGLFIGYLIYNWPGLPGLFAQPDINVYLLWGLLAATLSFFGNLLSVQAIKLAPNPGYPNAINSTNALVIMIVSFFIFGSSLNWLKVLGAVIISFGLWEMMRQKDKQAGAGWPYLALAAMLFFAGMVLVIKKMALLNFSPAQILLVLTFFAAIGYIGLNLFLPKRKKRTKVPAIIFLPVTLVVILSLVANLVNVIALKLAPNAGYSQAIMNGQTVLLLFLSALFFPSDRGGEFNAKRWLGALLVISGVVLIILG